MATQRIRPGSPETGTYIAEGLRSTPNRVGLHPNIVYSRKSGRRANCADVPVCGVRTCISQALTRTRERKSRHGNAAHSARIAQDWNVHRRRAAKHAPGRYASESGTGRSGTGEFAYDEGQRPQVFHVTLRGLRLISVGGSGCARKYFGHVRRRNIGGSCAAFPSSSDQKCSDGLRPSVVGRRDLHGVGLARRMLLGVHPRILRGLVDA